MIEITLAPSETLAEVGEFYANVGYDGGVAQSDIVLIARLEGHLAGVVRLCAETNVIVLRGMHVHATHQRQGLGKRLLHHCESYLDRCPAYCLPYEHLVAFYAQIGFEVAQPDRLPSFLAERLARYLSAGQRVLAMARMPT